MRSTHSSRAKALLGLLVLGAASPAPAALPAELLNGLRHGGLVILMRHASSPMMKPTSSESEPTNTSHERQLDAQGKRDAKAFGASIRGLHIPIGRVITSPTFRARETAELAGLRKTIVAPQLAEADNSMSMAASKDDVDWLRKVASKVPQSGTNTIIITHMPNITAAYPEGAKGLAAGEALILRPNGTSDTILARVKIEDWQ